MGFLEENGNSSVYKNLTKPDNTKVKQRWTLNLFLCCITVCFASFQFGYNIGSLNLITPVMKSYFEQVYFKELFFDKLAKFNEGKEKLENGTEKYKAGLTFYNEKQALFKYKLAEFEKATIRRNNYLDIKFGMDQEKIAEADRLKKEGEIRIRKEYNLTIEEFFEQAPGKLEAGKVKLAIGKEKLLNASILLKEGKKKLDKYTKLIDAGKKKLETAGYIIWGITNSLFVIGGMIGALTSKYVLDSFGRKNGILFHYLFSIIGSILLFLPPFLQMSKAGPILVKLGRFFQGIQGGMSCSLVPIYLSEIAPTQLRGQTGIIHNLFLTLGLFIAQFLGFKELLGTSSLWNILLSLPIVPAVLGGILLIFFFDETPKFLLFEKNDETRAIKSLQKLRNSDNVSTELRSLYVEGSEMSSQRTLGIFELIKTKELRWPLMTGILLQFAQQFCGINVIFFYSSQIMLHAGISEDHLIQIGVLLTGLTNVLCTLICVLLVDRFGRKPLLVWSMSIIVLDLALIITFMKFKETRVCAILALVCIIVFIVCYAVGLGPIPFIFIAEAFKQNSRSSAMSICVFVNWFSNLLLVLFFPIVLETMEGLVFLVFIVVILMTVSIIFKKMPETKNRSAEDITNEFNMGIRRSLELKNLDCQELNC